MYEMEKEFLKSGLMPKNFVRQNWKAFMFDNKERVRSGKVWFSYNKWIEDKDDSMLFIEFIKNLVSVQSPYLSRVQKINTIVSNRLNLDEALNLFTRNTPQYWIILTDEDKLPY